MAKALTEKMLLFCRHYMKKPTVKGAGEAYMMAYSKNNSIETATRAGQRLLEHPLVKEYIEEVRRRAMEKAGVELSDHLQQLEAIREGAKQAGQWSAATSAEIARGKVSGLYEHKQEVDADITFRWATGAEDDSE